MRKKRQWTTDEDAMIRLSGTGEVSMNMLEKTLHSNRKSITERARELGVIPKINPPSSAPVSRPGNRYVGEPQPGDGEVNTPSVIRDGTDPLLDRLRSHHG